jgi:hypothetical protein
VFTLVDASGRVLGQGRVANDPASLEKLLARSCGAAKVVLEAGGTWPVFTDARENHAGEVVLAHPLKTRASAWPGPRPIASVQRRLRTCSGPILFRRHISLRLTYASCAKYCAIGCLAAASRLKSSTTLSGRPRSSLSRITASKNARPPEGGRTRACRTRRSGGRPAYSRTRLQVVGCKWRGQAVEPPPEEGMQGIRAQAVTDPLQGGRIGAAAEAVVERLIRNANLLQLTFRPTVAIQPEPDGNGA